MISIKIEDTSKIKLTKAIKKWIFGNVPRYSFAKLQKFISKTDRLTVAIIGVVMDGWLEVLGTVAIIGTIFRYMVLFN